MVIDEEVFDLRKYMLKYLVVTVMILAIYFQMASQRNNRIIKRLMRKEEKEKRDRKCSKMLISRNLSKSKGYSFVLFQLFFSLENFQNKLVGEIGT